MFEVYKILTERYCKSVNLELELHKESVTTVGGVAQWLGRRSIAGGLSLIYAWSMVDV